MMPHLLRMHVALVLISLGAASSAAETDGEIIKRLCGMMGKKAGAEFEKCVAEETENNARTKKVFACRDNPQPLIGMDRDIVKKRCGVPYRKKMTTTAKGTTEQWVYGSNRVLFIYFENGKVTAVESEGD